MNFLIAVRSLGDELCTLSVNAIALSFLRTCFSIGNVINQCFLQKYLALLIKPSCKRLRNCGQLGTIVKCHKIE